MLISKLPGIVMSNKGVQTYKPTGTTKIIAYQLRCLMFHIAYNVSWLYHPDGGQFALSISASTKAFALEPVFPICIHIPVGVPNYCQFFSIIFCDH